MARTVGIAVALAYAALSCLIVSELGRAHRESLKARPGAAVEVAAAEPLAPPVAPQPTPAEPAQPAAPPVAVAATPPPETGPAGPAHKPEPPATPKAAAPAVAAGPPKSLRPAEIDPILARPEGKRIWDLGKFTATDEAEMGRLLNQVVMGPGQDRRHRDGAMERRLIEAGDPFIKACERQDVRYTYHILDSPAVNAFSHPGGYIYVTRGLMDWISEDQESALQFALAHEIHHVDHGDAIRCLRDPLLKEVPLGTLELLYSVVIPRGHGNKLEYEADAWAAQQLRRLQASRHDTLLFLGKLDNYAEDHHFLQGSHNPRDEPEIPLFDFQYRALPMVSERLKRVRELVDQRPAAKKAG